jgi:hypothetical protein
MPWTYLLMLSFSLWIASNARPVLCNLTHGVFFYSGTIDGFSCPTVHALSNRIF